jgi:hypothetical protein
MLNIGRGGISAAELDATSAGFRNGQWAPGSFTEGEFASLFNRLRQE